MRSSTMSFGYCCVHFGWAAAEKHDFLDSAVRDKLLASLHQTSTPSCTQGEGKHSHRLDVFSSLRPFAVLQLTLLLNLRLHRPPPTPLWTSWLTLSLPSRFVTCFRRLPFNIFIYKIRNTDHGTAREGDNAQKANGKQKHPTGIFFAAFLVPL